MLPIQNSDKYSTNRVQSKASGHCSLLLETSVYIFSTWLQKKDMDTLLFKSGN